MRNRLSTLVLIVFVFCIIFTSLLSAAQTAATPAPPLHKPAAAASVEPTAIIHTTAGDLSGYLDGHHDTITGPKRAAASFAAIASQAGVATGEVIYISDVTAELDAAREAGCATALALRPGNAPNPPHTHPEIHSFVEIEIA